MKNKSIIGIFMGLVLILAINPKIINDIYSSILGRIVLLGVVVFFSLNHTILGLLVALVIITASNKFGKFVEGMETNNTVQDKKSTEQQKTQSIETDGVDKEDVKTSLMSKNSNQLPIDPKMNSSSEVSASSSGLLNSSNNTLEGFSAYANTY